MTHLLRITDNTNTVTLSSGNLFISDYVPQVSLNGEAITEEAVIGLTNGTATARNNINAINRLLAQAANYTRNKSGKRVYVEFDPDTSGTVYRSRLYSGALELPDNVLGDVWGSGTIEATLTWTRDPFWEGQLTQIPLDNDSTTDSTTDYVTVNNANDSGRNNWVSISSSDIAGDLPSALKIEMLNATTDANATDEIYIFHNVYSTPASFAHWLEGESSTDASSTTDAGSSAAAYGAFSWSSTDETKIGEWVLPSTDLTDAAGGRFAVLARWPALFPYTNCWMRLTLETATNYKTLWSGNLSLVAPTTDADHTRELHLLDTLRLPPYLEGQSGIAPIVLRLYGLRSSTDNTVNVDWLQFSPISGESGWKHFKSVDHGVGVDETFIHDALDGYTYRQAADGSIIGEFTDYGGPILLVPNVMQRLYFNTCDYLGVAEPSQSWSIKAWYRPRRDSL